MKRILAAIFSAVFGLTSCSTHPPEHIETVNADAITFAVLSELYCTARDLRGLDKELYFASDDYWVAGIDMYLSAQIEAAANPAVSLAGPFNLAKAIPVGETVGSFTSIVSGSVDETRINMHEYKMYVYLKRLVYGYRDPKSGKTVPDWKTFAELNRWPVHCENPNAGGTFLQGQLGLEDWLAPAVRTQEASVGYAPLNPPPTPTPTPLPPAPTITDVFPKTGSQKGGDVITITGTNLATVEKVFFGDKDPITKTCDKPSQTTPCFTPSASMVVVVTPPGKGTVDLTVHSPSGDATSTFTYNAPLFGAEEKRAEPQRSATATAPNPPSSNAQQSPVITGTFTFTIKSGGTIGPSFTLTRVSGGSPNLFTATRTDNNYVSIVLTAAYYCPMLASLPAPVACAPTTTTTRTALGTLLRETATQPREPNADQLAAAIARIDLAILNQNIAKIASP